MCPTAKVVFRILLIVAFLSADAFSQSSLETPKWLDSVPCKEDIYRRAPTSFSDRRVMVCFEFEPRNLYAGKPDRPQTTDLNIVVYSAGPGNSPTIQSVSPEDPVRQTGLLIEPRFTQPPPDEQQGTAVSRNYPYRLTMNDQARAGFYNVRLSLENKGEVREVFWKVPIGPAPGANEWLEVTGATSVQCWTGGECAPFKIHLKNNLPYHLHVRSIKLASEPTNLVGEQPTIETKPVANHTPVSGMLATIAPGSVPHDFNLMIQSKLSWWKVFEGLGSSRLDLIVDYQDDFGREYQSKPRVDLQIKPNILILILTLLVGVVFGTVIRIDLRRLEKARYITRPQLIAFAATTIASGILVSLIALFANLKVVVFEDQRMYSSWEPRVLFITGLLGTIGGIPLIYSMLKLPVGANAAVPPGSKKGSAKEGGANE